MKRAKNAFTLIEILVVVILLAVIAGFGIPNYNASQARIVERDGEYNLSTIAAAMEMYSFRDDNENYPLGSDLDDVDEINTALSLGVVEQGIVYSCISDGSEFLCTANPNNYTWDVVVNNEGSPFCSNGPCPTL